MNIRTFLQTFAVGVGHKRRLGRTALGGLDTLLAETGNLVLGPWDVGRVVHNLADPSGAGAEDVGHPVAREGVVDRRH